MTTPSSPIWCVPFMNPLTSFVAFKAPDLMILDAASVTAAFGMPMLAKHSFNLLKELGGQLATFKSTLRFGHIGTAITVSVELVLRVPVSQEPGLERIGGFIVYQDLLCLSRRHIKVPLDAMTATVGAVTEWKGVLSINCYGCNQINYGW